MTEILDLPYELLEKVLFYTNGVTLLTCSLVCKKWKEFIVSNDTLWREFCKKDYRFASGIAKKKCRLDLTWYQVYRNMRTWPKLSTYRRNFKRFYNFSIHDKCHALDIDQSILALREARGTILYDMKTLKYIPVIIPERDCLKISSNDNVTALLLKTGLHIQRNAQNKSMCTETFLKADNFVLNGQELFFHYNREVYRLDLKLESLIPELILNCQYDIKEIQSTEGCVYIFSDCGKIVTINRDKEVHTKPFNCPEEWVKRIKHVVPLDDKNYICYSRNLFQIETENYRHLYLDFPKVTALFFYGDAILIGTKAGEILLYRMESQKAAAKPVFEIITVLPEQKFAVSLDVYERKTGPLIVITTFSDVFLLDIVFFPEMEESTKKGFTNRLDLYKRLLKLKDKLKN